jgi:RimJ/RimL family protein N-acetyltransferase
MIAQTKRLIIREFTPSDLDDLARLLADSEVMRFSISGPLNKEQAKEMLQKRILDHYEKYGFSLYALIYQDAFIGFAGLIVQKIDGEDLVELGYRLNPKYWGQGFATEAAIAICHYGFDQLKLDEIISIIDPKNTRSLAVASRIGMYFWKKTLFHNIPVQIYVLERLSMKPYQEEWPQIFAEEKEQLKKAFQNLDIDFYHIGSTSIPGCSAKPIIDILGVTSDVTKVDHYSEASAMLKTSRLPGKPGRTSPEHKQKD